MPRWATIMPDRHRVPAVPLPFWAWCALAVFCTALYTVSVPLTSAVYGLGLPVAFTIATVQCGSIVIAVSRPALGAALQIASIAALALATRDSSAGPWPLPVTGLVSLGALVLVLGIRERWVLSAAAWWLSVVTIVVVVATSPARYDNPDEWGTNLTIYTSYTATVLVAAIAIGQRHRIRADLAAAQRDVELEHAQRLYVEERSRIARELHDVVAHSMSLVHMQALSAPYRLVGAEQQAVHDEFESIARSARTALAEMRQMLGVLRGGDDAALAPQPQVGDIGELAAATARAGTPVDVAIDPHAGSASPIVQLTAYRIVQEALSNVVRHAPGSTTRVALTRRDDRLHVCVRNAPPSRAPASGTVAPDRGGQGIRGMRERVDLLGGDLTALPHPDGGFQVSAAIPVPTTDESDLP